MTFPSGTPEVVYVDSASRDQSVAIANGYGAQVVVLDAARQTAARARNAGAAKCLGEFILFLDGDTILAPGFVVDALPQFREPSIAVVWRQRREINPHASVYNTVVDLEWMSPPGFSEFCGGDAIMRRTAFEQAGGYDISLIAGEEPELCCRLATLSWKLLYLDIAMTGHDIAMYSFVPYWRRAVRTGYAYAQVSKRFESSSRPLWKKEARANQIRALGLLLGVTLSIAASLLSRSPVPAAAGLAVLAALIVRTAIKNRWKTPSLHARLLYGIHSHFQQIPIYWGQLSYRADVRKARTRSLIEYKTAP